MFGIWVVYANTLERKLNVDNSSGIFVFRTVIAIHFIAW
ncbi:MAG: hypothetical protein ACI9IP_002934 [Arcticibacterium sp.]|jgi:hypothetical protein